MIVISDYDDDDDGDDDGDCCYDMIFIHINLHTVVAIWS